MSKDDLIDTIITDKNKTTAYTQEDGDLTKEEARELLKNNNFTRKENPPPAIKARPKLNQNLLHVSTKSTIMNIFKSCNPIKDYYVRIYDIDNYFHERYNEKIKYDKNGN